VCVCTRMCVHTYVCACVLYLSLSLSLFALLVSSPTICVSFMRTFVEYACALEYLCIQIGIRITELDPPPPPLVDVGGLLGSLHSCTSEHTQTHTHTHTHTHARAHTHMTPCKCSNMHANGSKHQCTRARTLARREKAHN